MAQLQEEYSGRFFHEVPVRRSWDLLITFETEGLAAYDFLPRIGWPLNAVSMAILNAFSDWRPLSSGVGELSRDLGSYPSVAT
ncbi:hypothetical protein [Rhizobium leguminosarum]|uniref:hypothetical protein n=1 Tax=Rhizobium leguminosarum TaxID=384 RepID=UPI001C90B9C6|nr:hypothetical protein [Rhizobium leguminosarum]MBY3003734.1 hypothetical protein [Rhizobium leguminosarum]MBY3026798.1 hypothetical protein [Rhizobium leguminosarum]